MTRPWHGHDMLRAGRPRARLAGASWTCSALWSGRTQRPGQDRVNREVSRKCLGSVYEVSRKCLGSV